jgi:hypothetical protein
MLFKKPNPAPRGVPLKELEDALAPTTLKASRKGDTLIVKHEKLTTHVEVIAPANPESENGPISAVVTIKTPLPQEFSRFLSKPALVNHINTMASLGAVTEKDGQLFIGSRLTVYEGEDAWRIQFPHVTALPELTGTETLVTVLLSLLGLGAMRTAEKFVGKAK